MSNERYPVPFAMQEVPPEERTAATGLVDFAERFIKGAKIPFAGDNGDHFMYCGASVSAPVSPDSAESQEMAVVRPDWGEDQFELQTQAGASEVGISGDGKSLEGAGMDGFRATATQIEAGEAIGESVTTVAKVLERPGDKNPMMVEMALTRSTTEVGSLPTTTLDLRLVRHYGDAGTDMMVQTRRVEINPTSFEVRMGDAVEGQQWRISNGAHPSSPDVQWDLLSDPLPEHTGALVQERYAPPTPADRPLNTQEWQQLLLQDLNPRDMLQPHRDPR